MAGRLRRLLARLRDAGATSTCPICDRPVVVDSTAYSSSFAGTMRVQPTRQERVAACPEHGPPGNVPPGPPESGGDG